MVTAVGIVVFVLGVLAWIGQSLSFLAPKLAVAVGVMESPDDLDPTLHIIEGKAEALMDMLLDWTLPASAILMILDHPLWPYLALFGAGIYLYFAGLITLSRVYLKRAGRKVGRPTTVRLSYLFGGLWAVCAVAMVVLAAQHLST